MKINFERNINLTPEENENLRRAYASSEYFNVVTTIPTTETLKKGQVKFYNDGTNLWIYTSDGTQVHSQKFGVTDTNGLVGTYTVDDTGITDGMVLYYDSASGTIKFKTLSTAPVFAAGTVVFAKSLGETTGDDADYQLYKEIYVGVGGTISTTFDSKVASGSGNARLYVNGSAVGTERTINDGYQTFTENITVTAGDLVQVYCKSDGSSALKYVKNFKLMCSYFVGGYANITTHGGSVVNDAP